MSADRNGLKPLVFLADPEDDRFGVGWFLEGSDFVAYRRWVNGYEKYPLLRLERAVVETLYKAAKEGNRD